MSFNAHILTSEQRSTIPRLTDDDWFLLEKMNVVLSPTLDAIDFLEGDRYPTQGAVLMILASLLKSVDPPVQSREEINNRTATEVYFYSILNAFKEDLTHVWNQMPQETLIAALLDSRFKSLDFIAREEERSEAWKALQEEYEALSLSESDDVLNFFS